MAPLATFSWVSDRLGRTRRRRAWRTAALALAGVGMVGWLVACSKSGGEAGKAAGAAGQGAQAAQGSAAANAATAVVAVSPAAQKQAQEIFTTRCVMCHGPDGKGQGAAAAALNPKPRDYTDAKWQDAVTNKVLADTIIKGGEAMGMSMMMPANPDLKDKADVVQGIVNIIRGFRGK